MGCGGFGEEIDDPAGGGDYQAGERLVGFVDEAIDEDPGVYEEKEARKIRISEGAVKGFGFLLSEPCYKDTQDCQECKEVEGKAYEDDDLFKGGGEDEEYGDEALKEDGDVWDIVSLAGKPSKQAVVLPYRMVYPRADNDHGADR